MIEKASDGAQLLLKTIGRRVRLPRLVNEMTQDDLATAAGMSRSFLSLIEHGTHGVDIIRLYRLSAALEMPLVELIAERQADDR